MNWKNALGLILWATLSLTACREDSQRDIPDVSGVEVNVVIRRFEQDLFAIDTNEVASQLERLEAAYPEFSEVYFEYILSSRNAPDGHAAYVEGFLKHPAVRHLYDTCQVVYPHLDDIRTQFREILQFFRYYFPEDPLPDLTTFISEYSYAAFIYGEGNSLAVGLDFFLGDNFPYQQYNPQNPNFSSYLTRTFNRDHLMLKTLHPLIDNMLGPGPGERLLDHMVHNGKKLYLADLLMPFAQDSVKLELPPQQVEWLSDNEREMWAYFLQEDLLYSSNWQDIRKYVEYSPHSPGMPPEAPGRTANWLGWQIIKAYMERFPDTTPWELIGLTDAQQLLEASRYKPER